MGDGEIAVTEKTTAEQVVLYTLYRGPYPEGPYEIYLQGAETGDYSRMVTEIMIPYEMSK